MWIIKLGGSLLSSGHLSAWLSIITEFGGGRLIIVPGGGIFADQIRIAQQQWQFDDRSAHRMALLAMEQYAHLLQYHAPQLRLADCREDIQQAIALQQIPVWLPSRMVDAHAEIAADWSTTSDSLALWLAQDIHATQTMLVKSSAIVDMNARQLSAAGMVDKKFPELVKDRSSCLWWLCKDDMPILKKLLETAADPKDHLRPINY